MNSKRLQAIASLILPNETVLDIGCDHAYLARILNQKKIKTVSSDISSNVISKYSNLYPDLEFRLGNGLNVIKDSDNFTTIVISGMGSFLIKEILTNIKKYHIENIIISSHTKSYEIREFLTKLGYMISDEKIIFEQDKFYEIDKFSLGKKDYTYEEIFLGPINIKNKTKEYKNYLTKRIAKIEEILTILKKQEKPKELEEILDILKNNI